MIQLYQNLQQQKLAEVGYLSSCQYSVNTKIMFKILMVRSYLYVYIDACIVVKGRTSITGTHKANRKNTKVTFKNNAPCSMHIKINNTFIDLQCRSSRYSCANI